MYRKSEQKMFHDKFCTVFFLYLPHENVELLGLKLKKKLKYK